MDNLSIMIVGVGGQGTLLASKIMGSVFTKKGYDVKVSEVHGMSQRGGSVVTYIKIGKKVYSPVIELGEADVIISFEQLEAARWTPYLKTSGKMIINLQKIDPMPVITGAMKYPEEIIEKIKDLDINEIEVDALKLAVEAGSPKAVNVVLLGVIAKSLPAEKQDWIKAVEEIVPQKFLELNLVAFEKGYNY